MILAGDVGGTKVLLALVEEAAGTPRVVTEARYETARHEGLSQIVADFLASGSARPARAAIGVAGPVVDGRVEMTNLPWAIDARALERELGCPVVLLNDLEAAGHALADLAEEQTLLLQPGVPLGRTRALIAPGTGLGMAIATEVEGGPLVLASEGGHADFAARDEEDDALLAWLRPRYGRVSVERVASGPGIRDVYDFLRDTGRYAVSVDFASRLDASDDPPATISRAALEEGEPICVAAMKRFSAALGATAGNLALTALALDGVWIAGGIAPAIVPLLRDGPFLAAFRDKEPLSELMERIPVRVVLEERAALLGAARYAMLD